MRSAITPIAQGALFFTVSFFAWLCVEAAAEHWQWNAELLHAVDLTCRGLMGLFTFLLLIFFVVHGLRWLRRRARAHPLPGLGTGVLYAGAALVLSLPFALNPACNSFDRRATLDGSVYLLRLAVAWDGDGTILLYQCNALSVDCTLRKSAPFTPRGDMNERVRLLVDPAQHSIGVADGQEPLLGYSPRGTP